MRYDENGTGYAEMSFIAITMPEIYEQIEGLLSTPLEALRLARKAIAVWNQGMIG